ncbi:hypothetical protein [Amycolatopsis sp. NPDC004079]|uniref:hypothetical protein n=1 Tax=Amycolatopsis sp. NPDC004079 TaxID=3154549 RepID=UPI0033B7DEFA
MDVQEQANSAADDDVQRWRETGRAFLAGYWDDHEIVRRSDDEIRRGEAPAYVRRRQ